MTATVDRLVETRRPPHSREAEVAVLGAALTSSDAAVSAMTALRTEDFYRPAHQEIFAAMRHLFDSNMAIDAVTVGDYLSGRSRLEACGGMQYMIELMDAIATTAGVGFHAAIIFEHAMRRRLIDAAARINELAFKTDRPAKDAVDAAEQVVFGVSEHASADSITSVGELLNAAIDRVEEASRREGLLAGLSTGFDKLDEYLGGLQKGNLIVIAARPALGKTSLALNIAQNIAQEGKKALVFSLEMSAQEIAARLLAAVAKVDSRVFRSGIVGNPDRQAEVFKRLNDAANKLFHMNILIDESPAPTVTEIRAKCRRQAHSDDGLDLVVVDYMQLMDSSQRGENRQQEIAEISRSLKLLAGELKVPIIAVSQLNRQPAQTHRRPQLSDLRESGAIEQDADVVLFIHRDEQIDSDGRVDASRSQGVVEVIVGKHRGGPTGTVKLYFVDKYTLFQPHTERAVPTV
ncbi:MAG: replicative DNA helicase [Acidimicrobiia bacterium]